MKAAVVRSAQLDDTAPVQVGPLAKAVQGGNGPAPAPALATPAPQGSIKPAADASPTPGGITVEQAALDTPHVPVGGTQQVPSPKPTTAPCAPAGPKVLVLGVHQCTMDVQCALLAHGPAVE